MTHNRSRDSRARSVTIVVELEEEYRQGHFFRFVESECPKAGLGAAQALVGSEAMPQWGGGKGTACPSNIMIFPCDLKSARRQKIVKFGLTFTNKAL